ncbi:Rv0361 family membrane protein [Micromonospora coxensis]|uniref:Ig-like domain-containing protein n=1 Tax=Micromonospora coxensis TaxID=356852 RepID=A0A1C5ILE8_9ACTN|nr:hypothetical protein [Micromonospora coxensis]SCG58829.1 hypothetical protein GA0070614_2965 [Micromonospora coxensis]
MTQPPTDGATGSPSSPPPGPASPGTSSPGGVTPSPAYPAYRSPADQRRRGRLVATLTLVAAILLCGGGGTAAYLALRDTEEGAGAKEPAVAVDDFLSAVYRERDAGKATGLVCAASRDPEKIAAKVAEVDRYAAQYTGARFRWATPTVDSQNGDRATVSAKVTMTTADEKIAEQALRFTVVRKAGWRVCEVA